MGTNTSPPLVIPVENWGESIFILIFIIFTALSSSSYFAPTLFT